MIETTQNGEISEGETILVSEGSYSDYGVIGIFRAKINFNIQKEGNRLAAERGKDFSCYDRSAYCAWLEEKGFIEEIKYREWHLGDYGKLDPRCWSK